MNHCFGFGSNIRGQISPSYTQNRTIPSCIPLSHITQTLPTIRSIICGGSISMYLTESRQVYCYGADGSSLLGDEPSGGAAAAESDASRGRGGDPINASAGSMLQFHQSLQDTDVEIAMVAAGEEHQLFVTHQTRELYARGWNLWGQLGIPQIDRSTSIPRKIPFFQQLGKAENSRVAYVACGPYCSFVLLESGTLYSFGHSNLGQCGIGSKQEKILTPKPCLFEMYQEGSTQKHQITTPPIKKIAVGYNHSVVLTQDGRIFVAGSNFYGQISHSSCTKFCEVHVASEQNDATESSSEHHYVRFKDIACGFEHTVLLSTEGTVYVTGRNQFGECGLGHQKPVKHFTQLALFNIQSVHCGYNFSLFLANNGTLWACGDHTYGSLGIGTMNASESTPSSKKRRLQCSTPQFVKFPGKRKVEASSMIVSCGGRHTIVMLNENSFVSIEKSVYRSLLDAKSQLETDLREQKKIVKEFEHAVQLLQDEEKTRQKQIDVVIHYDGVAEKYSFVPVSCSDDSTQAEALKRQICGDLLKLLLPEGIPVDQLYRVQYWDEKFQMYLDVSKHSKVVQSWNHTKIVVQDVAGTNHGSGTAQPGKGGSVQNRAVARGSKSFWQIHPDLLHIGKTSDGSESKYANHSSLDVSVKRIDLTKSGTSKRIIAQEVSLVSQLNHERILKCIGMILRENHHEADVVLEQAQHNNIVRYIQNNNLNMVDRLGLLMQIAEGMYYLHSNGLIHHYLSPHTLCVTKEGNVKIVPSLHLAVGQQDFLGQLTYFAPEYYAQNYGSDTGNGDSPISPHNNGLDFMHAEDDASVQSGHSTATHPDHRVDIYSFGILMWQIVSLQTPFQDLIPLFQRSTVGLLKKIHHSEPPLRPPLDALGDIPDALREIIKRCWSRDANDRFQNFKEVLEALHKQDNSVQLYEKLKSFKSSSDGAADQQQKAEISAEDNNTYTILIKYQDITKRITLRKVKSADDLCRGALDVLPGVTLSKEHYKFYYYDKEFEENVELDSLEHVPHKMVMTINAL